jgi:hypothetical protein
MKVFGPFVKPAGDVRVASRSTIGEHPHDHNLYYSAGNSDPIGVPVGKGDIIADPLFVDYENRNFRLKEKSPARNKGVKLGYTIDLDNYPLLGKNSTDIGAYEF